MHTNNRFFDDIARVVTGAAGAAQGVRADVETALRLRMERVAQDLDLASREDVEALKDLLAKTNSEMETLRARLDALEAELAAVKAPGTQKKPRKRS
ncbi:MAG: accessory factor UbiK family protein [Alphaproteobacteria bacterium]